MLGFVFATSIILVLTLTHWTDFMADPLPHRPSWIGSYVLDPLLGVVVNLAKESSTVDGAYL